MKKSIKLLSIMFMVVALLVSCGGETKTDKKIVWKFGHLSNTDHLWNKTAEKFAELVAAKTDGKIEVKVYPNEQLGNEMDTLNMIQNGTADLTITGESMAAYAPKAALMAVPYAIENTDMMYKLIASDLGKEIENEIIEKVNVKPLYFHVRAPRNLTSNYPISTPADLNGFKMRVPNVPLFLDAWKAAGAQPQVMAFSEVFTGLQQNVIAGQENPYDLIYSASFYEVQKYVNETEHVNSWIYVVLGKNQYDALTPELREKVEEAAEETQKFADDLFVAEIADYKQKLIDKGMIINSDVDKAAFREAMKPAIQNTLNEEQLDLYNRMIEFK